MRYFLFQIVANQKETKMPLEKALKGFIPRENRFIFLNVFFFSVSCRCKDVKEEAAICAICFAEPHRMHHVVCHSDHNTNKVF